jgi:hypothetical protein
MTTTTNKVLPVALVAALLGGTVGAFVMRDSKKTPEVAVASEQARTNDITDKSADANKAVDQNALLDQEVANETKNMTDEERAAFRDGFGEGVQAARANELTGTSTARSSATTRNVVYRPATRTRYVSRSAPRRVYYDYGQRSGRSFWQKHRDKLTVAMGTGGGALLGGLIGGKRGAGIGALAGAGGSALYTYKVRKRNRNY